MKTIVLLAILVLLFAAAAVYDLSRAPVQSCRSILSEAAALNYKLVNSDNKEERKYLEAKISKLLAQQCAFL